MYYFEVSFQVLASRMSNWYSSFGHAYYYYFLCGTAVVDSKSFLCETISYERGCLVSSYMGTRLCELATYSHHGSTVL